MLTDKMQQLTQKLLDLITLKVCFKNEDDAPPLTPEDIVSVLKDRGWEAEIVKAEKIAGEFFKKFDTDNDGNIDIKELQAGLEKELNVSIQ